MRFIKQNCKSLSCFLALLIILHGCTVYKRQNISLKEAARTQDKVKMVTKQGQVEKYLYIDTIDEKFYGINKVNDEVTKTFLTEENFQTIRTEDKGTSILLSIVVGGPLAVAGLTLLIIYGLYEWDRCLEEY